MSALTICLFIVIALAGCGGGGGAAPAPADGWSAEVLGSGTYLQRYEFQRLRLNKTGHLPAYAIWFPAPGATASAKAAAVVLPDPYGGIDWTGEAFDVETANLVGHHGFQMIEDVRGPYFDAAIPTFVPYDYSEIDDAGGGALPYLINGISAIVVYERVYAGGSLQNDIDDTLAAFDFLQLQPGVDRTRIGVWGSSYGGSLALYAAARAPAGSKPVFGAVSTPIVDWQRSVPYAEWMAQTHSDPGKAILRLDPFRRRAVAAATPASGAADYAPYSDTALVASLNTKFLFIHDAFDTISPLYQADQLYFGTPGRHQTFIYPHQGVVLDWSHFDITHAPVAPGFDEASAILFSQSYLLTRLASSKTEVLLPRYPTLKLNLELFAYLRAQGQQGFDLNFFLVPRLLELCDPRVQLVNPIGDFMERESGRHFVSQLLNDYWQAGVNEKNVVDWLQNMKL